jgi:hypothetical protein
MFAFSSLVSAAYSVPFLCLALSVDIRVRPPSAGLADLCAVQTVFCFIFSRKSPIAITVTDGSTTVSRLLLLTQISITPSLHDCLSSFIQH